MAYQEDNIFAKILRGEAPAVKVYEDDHSFVMMDIMPESRGHLLILPKEAAQNLFEVSAEALGHCMKTCHKVALALMQATGADGLRLVQFNHAAAGQTVFHLHFHLIPVYQGQAKGAHADERRQADSDDLAVLAKEIAALIAA